MKVRKYRATGLRSMPRCMASHPVQRWKHYRTHHPRTCSGDQRVPLKHCSVGERSAKAYRCMDGGNQEHTERCKCNKSFHGSILSLVVSAYCIMYRQNQVIVPSTQYYVLIHRCCPRHPRSSGGAKPCPKLASMIQFRACHTKKDTES